MTKVTDLVKATGAALRRLSTVQQRVRFHMTDAPQPRVEPVRWHAGTGAPGWVAHHSLVPRPGADEYIPAMQAREFPNSTFDVSFKQLAALWKAWYEPRQGGGGENRSLDMRFSEYNALEEVEESIDPLVGPTEEHRQARNKFFDKLARDMVDDLYTTEARLDKATTALVEHKPPAGMQALQLRDADRTQVWLRPLEGADAYQFQEFLTGLSDASFNTRFPYADASQPMREKLAAQLARNAEAERGFAVQDTDGRIVAHMDLKPVYRWKGTCEFDVIVADTLQGQGLGAGLLLEAKKLAEDAGYTSILATVSVKNERMAKLLKDNGFTPITNFYAARGHQSYTCKLGTGSDATP